MCVLWFQIEGERSVSVPFQAMLIPQVGLEPGDEHVKHAPHPQEILIPKVLGPHQGLRHMLSTRPHEEPRKPPAFGRSHFQSKLGLRWC